MGPIHHLFAAQAAARPEAAAAVWGEEVLTYAALEARANRLARFLIGRGIGPESLVGVLLPRSLDLPAAILGVLKSGAAYVPLDPGYPADRLRYIWQDARAGRAPGAGALLLGSAALAGWLPDGEELVDPACRGAEIAAQSPAAPAVTVLPGNLAYVIYTSGSTGRPKGVAVAHGGLVNTLRVAVASFGLGPGSRVLQLASISFDASVLEIWMALAAGGTLVLTPRETLLSGEALGRELTRREVTAMAIPPSLLERVPGGDFPHLRSVVVGAEACSAATARRWSAGRALFNAYAPTEATIFATLFACAPEQQPAPPLGRAIPGMRAELLGPDLLPAAPGEEGEIFLGGAGLARGYLGRPELTAERFVPDPAAATAGERLYRTGDLGRLLPSGDLQFAGRADQQVKIRGLRVELGEIEAVLAGHPAVRSAVVTYHDAAGAAAAGDKRLVAYFVAADAAGGGPATSELRAFLARQLPDYMVPASFVRLDSLPATPTGKIDRRALPAPGRERPGGDEGYVAPQGAREEALARIWGEVLGLDLVGRLDDLFELGGHSLIASQIVSRVRAELGLELPLLDVFTRPTVAALAGRLAELERPVAGHLSAVERSQAAAGAFAHGGRDREEPAAAPARARPVTGSALPLPPVERADRGAPLPLSYAQERVWFLNQLAPGAIAYNFQFTVRFRGPLAPATLAQVLREVVRRHEVLRTSFPASGGRPRQEIHAAWPPGLAVLPVVDLSALGGGRREATAESRVQAEIRRGFDVTRLPLVRWLLLRLAPDDHLLLHVEHHFVHDGWSLAVFLGEVKALYRAFARGAPSPRPAGSAANGGPGGLPELPIQYADFAVWQRRWLLAGALDEQLAWWKRRLAGAPQLALPADRPRPRLASFRGGALRVDLPHALYEAVRGFSRRSGSTLFMTMLATFYTLLHRYSGQEDVALGSGYANRRLRESESLIGMVVNTVVLRTAFASGWSFRRLLAAVRETTLEAHVYQDLPFEKLVEELQPERELSRNPLFQVLFSFHDAPVPDLEFAGLSGELLERHNGSAKSDLNVVAKPRAEQRVSLGPSAGDELTMVWEYSGDLYEAATIDRMWGHFQVLLAGVVAGAEASLAELPLLTAGESAQLAAWSRGAAPPGSPADPESDALDLPRRIAAHAARRPRAPAVEWEGGELTWGELERRSRGLAAELRARGVGPEVVVAICAERSPETVIAALAVLRAGGAWLPLDPGHPRERLELMLRDAGAALVIARPDLVAALPAAAPPVVELDAAAPPPVGERVPAADEAPGRGAPDHLAYVIYTSGSTGVPKGVEIHRAGLANLVAWHLDAYGVGPEDRATLLAGPAFDASVWELWPYLAAGASLHLPPAEVRGSPAGLLAWLARRQITICFLPTPLAAAVLDEVARRPPPGLALRALLTGGDRLAVAPASELPFALWNHYGPTESTVVSTAAEVPTGLPGAPPIGRPIAGLRALVLDGAGRRVPAGVPGELVVGGAGLARGYRRRPDLTAERFVPDRWGDPGSRLYRTGDLARWTPAGQLEFLGRCDRQLKLRGFRVEPGEIEAALRAHPEVREAAVAALPAPAGEARLVAWVVWDDPAGAPAARGARRDELRRRLAERLPDYMVPAAFVELASLPLTRNGKVDLAALPAPEPAAAGERGAAPSGAIEELLHGTWSVLLGRSDLSADDNFFHLGGHSLLATQLLSRVRDAVGVEVPLAGLFAAPTIAGLAHEVERLLAAPGSPADAAAAPAISRRAVAGPAPLSFAQERLWVLEQLSPGGSAYNIGRAWVLEGELLPAALGGALTEIVRRHEALRTRFATVDDQPVQVVDPAGGWNLPVADLQALPATVREREGERLAGDTARRPFALASGPLLRTLLLREGPHRHRLLLAMHHVISDGWSLALFMRELAALYPAAAGGAAAVLPELPVQYADYALWQRRRLADGALVERLLGYWRRQLAGAPPALELPFDRPRPPVRSLRGDVRWLALPAAQAAQLQAFAWRQGATPFMVLLAVLAALLGRYSSRSDVVVGSPIAGRNRSEIERLIGFFVNTLVLRSRWRGDPALGELVSIARQATLAAHAHQELPFERLVAELQPDRELGQTPLFQVMFTLQSAAAEPALPGLRLAPVAVVRREARFDLEIEVADGPAPRCSFRYDSDLFDGATVARMGGHFANLLAALLADPGCRLAAAPMLSPGERHQLGREWNDSRSSYPREALVHELFEEWVGRSPEAVAVVWGDEALSYGALDRRAERLAARLRRLGVGPDEPVAVALERSPALIVALLAVLKAGGAYVPLDAESPPERLRRLLGDSGSQLVLADGAWEERLRRLSASHVEVVTLGAGGEPLGAPPPSSPPAAAAATVPRTGNGRPRAGAAASRAAAGRPGSESLAYVMYTSGTTGRPKGVAVPHRAVVRLVRESNYARLDAAETLLQLAPPAFDASTLEIWGALANGGRLVLFPGTRPSLEELAAELARQQVSTLWLTAGLFQEMVAGYPEGLAPVRQLLAGGDVLPPAQVRAALAARPDRVVVNGYGPTENTTFTCCYPARQDGAVGASVPLGRPIANTRVHLLDGTLAPVPIGAPGELCAAGDGLARGYLGRPELTAERFVPDPQGGSGERLYRTGDLARRLATGEIEFLGRIDQQVKVRGHRVEPGEVEAALAEHPAVAQAAVIAWPPGPEHAAERRLVAYVVLRPEAAAALPPPADAAELGAFLRQRLPEPMVPASFVQLAALPLTANGKLDRRALPAPERPPAESRSRAAPRTDEERVVAAVWAGVLGTDQIGVDDNFFQLGGNSLLATRVITRLRRELGVEVPLRSLFLTPTVAGIARTARGLRHADDGEARSAGETGEARPRLVPLPRAASRRQRSALGPPREP